MNFFTRLQTAIHQALRDYGHKRDIILDLSKVTLESPKDPTHGDLACNAAMVLSKQLNQKSIDLAQNFITLFQDIFPKGATFDVAGPGFLNITLPHFFWQDEVKNIATLGTDYRPTQVGREKSIHIEFVSANPTGPMHTGHARNAVVGDAIASLMEAVGYDVHREYYINDAGSQVDTLARSLYLRYQQLFGIAIPESAFEGLYPGDYVRDMASDLKQEKGDFYLSKDETFWLEDLRAFSIAQTMKSIQKDLFDLGVVMDTYTSEAALTKDAKIDEVVKYLEEKGDVYVGVLEPPKGHAQDKEDIDPRPQTLFRSTKYGDTMDRALKKADGSWSYFAPDIAYHYDKFKRGHTHLIDILGVDHVGYFSRIQAAVKAITDDQARLTICHYNIVNFLENGVPLKMSKRAGTFISLRDLLDKVGRDVVRFIMLTRHHNSVIDFDFVKVLECTKENPIFYVQYAYARISSVMRHAKNIWDDLEEKLSHEQVSSLDVSFLSDSAEIDLIKVLSSYPKTVEVAASLIEPHRIAYYLYNVASSFHSLWNKGKDNVALRFIDEHDERATMARLLLLKATQTILKSGLSIFKIMPMEEMRS